MNPQTFAPGLPKSRLLAPGIWDGLPELAGRALSDGFWVQDVGLALDKS